ncbi:lysylphosphatidylglycerol synthase transmembrane domain-containing protein [Pseudalkalibacillus hwajinpoensis]|uniref:Phosphatidylglycerol lysyltransferase n=1 Tax=Guptibacillus hwajinpoensis TaxID=208199 RepID=A0A4U1MIQ0_9BACL|nr:lysylphosphatidylglycerol synthase transmembrane domain-containing protein [Pseudalkalibacillus hwajinpoensis]TKD70352.1 flippase-like domain-containing protein [Pseudalkalibacillus hwajinpoensis]
MGKKIPQLVKWTVGLLLVILFIFLLLNEFNLSMVTSFSLNLLDHPVWFLTMISGYTASFLLRGWCWQLLVDQKIKFRVYISGIFYSLFFNHLLPFKGGEAVRMGVLAQEQQGKWGTAVQSVVLLRIVDLFWLGLFAIVGAALIGISVHLHFLIGSVFVLVASGLLVILFLKKSKFRSALKQLLTLRDLMISPNFPFVLVLSCISWIAEGVVVFGVASLSESTFTYLNAMWITALSVGAGVFQLAPGGFATYESVMSFSLNQVGFGWEEALSIALITHAFKYLYSFAAGVVAFYLYPLQFRKLKTFLTKKGETS